jgi:hypothetical protein
MSIGADLLRAEKTIKHIEASLDNGIANAGAHLEIAFYIEYVDCIMKSVEKAPPSMFVHLYIYQIEKLSELRRRWRAAKGRYPGKYLDVIPNPEISKG